MLLAQLASITASWVSTEYAFDENGINDKRAKSIRVYFRGILNFGMVEKQLYLL